MIVSTGVVTKIAAAVSGLTVPPLFVPWSLLSAFPPSLLACVALQRTAKKEHRQAGAVHGKNQLPVTQKLSTSTRLPRQVNVMSLQERLPSGERGRQPSRKESWHCGSQLHGITQCFD